MSITYYSYKSNQWTKRESLFSPTLSTLYDTQNLLNKHFGVKHWVIPTEYNPYDYPELLNMESVMKRHVNQFDNDFYLHDVSAYLSSERHGLWMLRDSGTHFVPLGDKFETNKIDYYLDCLSYNKYTYLVNNGKIQELSIERSRHLLQKQALSV